MARGAEDLKPPPPSSRRQAVPVRHPLHPACSHRDRRVSRRRSAARGPRRGGGPLCRRHHTARWTMRRGRMLWRRGGRRTGDGVRPHGVLSGIAAVALRHRSVAASAVRDQARRSAIPRCSTAKGTTMKSVRATQTPTALALGRDGSRSTACAAPPTRRRFQLRRLARVTPQPRATAVSFGNLALSLGGDVAAPPGEDAARRSRARGTAARPTAPTPVAWRCFIFSICWRSGVPDVGPLCPLPALGGRCSPRARRRQPAHPTINGAVEKVLARGDRRLHPRRTGRAGEAASGYSRASSTACPLQSLPSRASARFCSSCRATRSSSPLPTGKTPSRACSST